MYRCPNCHYDLPADARFCNKCGLTPIRTTISSPAQTQQELSLAPSYPVQSPADAPSSRPSQQAPKRAIQPAAKHTPAARLRPFVEHVGKLSHASWLPQLPENVASSSEQVPVPPVESLHSPWCEDALHPIQTAPKEENKPGLIRPIGTDTPSTPEIQPVAPAQPRTKLLGRSVQLNQPAQSTPLPKAPVQPSSWIPGTLGLSLPSIPRTLVQEQPSKVVLLAPLLSEAQRSSQLSEVNSVLIPATDSLRGQNPVPGTPLAPVEPLHQERAPGSLDANNLHPPSAESITATSKAAEHWRTSWQNRQLNEARPARGVSRGQAPVAEPLLARQHTLLQVQAVLLPRSKSRAHAQGRSLGFWVTMILMLILLCSLGAYSISTYLPGTQFASQLGPSIDGPHPVLTLIGTNRAVVTAGQRLRLHGEHFGVNNTITFALETTPLGSPVQSTLQGTFDASITVPSNWLAGAYALEAQDNRTGKHAFLDIQVLPGATTDTTAISLEDAQGNLLTSLAFTAVISKADAQKQPIYLKNTSDVALSWAVAAIADKNLGWLLVEEGTTSGTLKPHQATSVTIGVITSGLKIGSYTGHAILTVASQGQIILPVTLTIADSTIEVVITPNPIVALIQPGGACQPVPLTLINLSNTASIRWDVKGDDPYDQQHISFNGGPEMQGSLSPAGQEENSAVLKVTCRGIQPGITYKVTVYYNNTQVHVPIIIRPS